MTHKLIENFLQEVELAQEKPARKLAKEHKKALADIDRRMAPHDKAVAKAKKELEDARTWLESIPISATPGDIATRQVIADKWPARVSELQMAREVYLQEKRARETRFNADVRHLNAEIGAEIYQAIVDLKVAKLNAWRFVD